MNTLHIVLKNGKVLKTKPAPFIQIMQWYLLLRDSKSQPVNIIKSDGAVTRMQGNWVYNMAIDKDFYTVDEAGVAMMMEPYTHYSMNGRLFQYSEIGQGFEEAVVRQGVVRWYPAVLLDGPYIREGQNSCVNPNMLVALNT